MANPSWKMSKWCVAKLFPRSSVPLGGFPSGFCPDRKGRSCLKWSGVHRLASEQPKTTSQGFHEERGYRRGCDAIARKERLALERFNV